MISDVDDRARAHARTRLVRTSAWTEILRNYQDLEARHEFFTPMRQLVEHVASQPYAPLLFATTSMHALLVAQHPVIEWDHDVLRVERGAYEDSKNVTFAFHESEFVKPASWECPVESVIGTFEGFLRRSKWVNPPP